MKINLRESLNKIDLATNNKYDLLNTFNSIKLSDNSKKKLVEAIESKSIASVNKILHESEEQLYKVVLSSGATKYNFESALYKDEAEGIVDYYDGRWIDENGFEWDMYVEEDDDSTEHAMVDDSYDMENEYNIDEAYNEDPYIRLWDKDSQEYKNLDKVASWLTYLSPNNIYYAVEQTYFDYGQDWKWTTIIAYRSENDSWQAINPRQQKNILLCTTDEELEEVAKDILRESRLDKGFNESLNEDLSSVEEIKQLDFTNNRVNNLRGIFSTKSFVKALNDIGLDKFKIRTSRLKNISKGDLKDAWYDLKRNGWSMSIERDPSLSGFNEVYVFEKITNESLDKQLTEASYGGAYDIEDDMFFTKEEIVEFADNVCEYLGDVFGYQYDINNVYMDGPRKLYINIYDNNYIEVESAFDIDMRKIRKPSDLFKVYGLTIENWFQKAFAREYRDAGLDESLNEQKYSSGNYFITVDETGMGPHYSLYYQHPHSDYDGLMFIVDGYGYDNFKEKLSKFSTVYPNKDVQNLLKNIKKHVPGKEESLEEQINLPGYAVKYTSGYSGNGVNSGKTEWFRTKEERDKRAKELKDKNYTEIKTWKMDNFYHTLPKSESLKESIDDETDFETDFDDGEVEEGNVFFADGTDWVWEERIAGPLYLDFDKWAVWSARESVDIRDFIIGKNDNGGWDIDKEAYIEAVKSKPIVYFIVDEDTGFIDWGPVENEIEAKDFLNGKQDDWDNDNYYGESLKEDFNDSTTFEIYYDDIDGEKADYYFEVPYIDVLEFLANYAEDEEDAPQDEEELLKYVDKNFDRLYNEYEYNVLDHFYEDAEMKYQSDKEDRAEYIRDTMRDRDI